MKKFVLLLLLLLAAEKLIGQTDEQIRKIVKAVLDESGTVKIGALHVKSSAVVFDSKSGYASSAINDPTVKAIIDKTTIASTKSYTETNGTSTNTFNAIVIDSAQFDIREGMIEYLKVYSNGTYYYNKKAPIAIVYIDERGGDKLYNANNDKFIFLENAVVFETDKRFGFLPSDENFLIKAGKSKALHANNGINSLVSFTSYTDLLGLLGNQPNPIIHLEGSAKFYLHRKNISNTFMYLFSSVEPFLYFNKIDSQFDTIRVDNNVVNRVEIFRRHTYAVGMDLSLFRWDWKPSNSLELKIGYMYSSTNMVVQTKATQAVLHTPYLDIAIKSKVIHNFGVDVSGRLLIQSLNENRYFDSDKENTMASVRGSIFYSSPKGNGQDKIFLRFTNYLNFSDRRDDFAQLQLGFTKALKI